MLRTESVLFFFFAASAFAQGSSLTVKCNAEIVKQFKLRTEAMKKLSSGNPKRDCKKILEEYETQFKTLVSSKDCKSFSFSKSAPFVVQFFESAEIVDEQSDSDTTIGFVRFSQMVFEDARKSMAAQCEHDAVGRKKPDSYR